MSPQSAPRARTAKSSTMKSKQAVKKGGGSKSSKGDASKNVKKELGQVNVPSLPPGSAPTATDSVERKLLATVAYLRRAGFETQPRDFVAAITGFTNTSSKAYVRADAALRAKGLLTHPSGTLVSLTLQGIEEVGEAGVLPESLDEAYDRIKAFLPGKGILLLSALLDGKAYSREVLSQKIGFTNLSVRDLDDSNPEATKNDVQLLMTCTVSFTFLHLPEQRVYNTSVPHENFWNC
jgi:hypothetical protein